MIEQDRFRVRHVVANNEHPRHEWHSWWAWRPVRTTAMGEWVWLTRIYRRALYKTYATYNDYQQYEYGREFDILKSPAKPAHQQPR